jgi:multiple sugar transport system substrate-binding protein
MTNIDGDEFRRMKRMSRKFGSRTRAGVLFAALAACGLAAAGCSSASSGGNSGGQSGTVTITEEDAYTYPASTVMNQLISQFEKQNPGYKVQRTVVPYEDDLTKMLHQASSNSLPSVLMVDEPWLPEMAAGGVLVPLSKFGFTGATLNSGARAVGMYNGALYGASTGNNSLGLVYNKTMFAQAHLQPPKTWAEMLADAKALTRNGVYGFGMGAAQGAPADWQFEPFFWTAGGSLTHVNNAGGVAALTYLTQLVKSGGMPKSVVNWTQSEAAAEFANGKLAMVDIGPWEIPSFTKVSWGAETMPVPHAGTQAISPVGGPPWAVAKGSPAQEKAAWKFVSWLLKPANVTTFAVANDDVPSLQSLDATLVKTHPDIALFAKSTETGRSRTTDVGVHYNAVAQALTNAIEAALTGTQPPQHALDAAQTQVQAALKS